MFTFETRPVTKNVTFVKIADKEFEAGVVMDVLHGLDNTDGFFTAIDIYDTSLRKILIDLGVARPARGNSHAARGPLYDEFMKNLSEEYYNLTI